MRNKRIKKYIITAIAAVISLLGINTYCLYLNLKAIGSENTKETAISLMIWSILGILSAWVARTAKAIKREQAVWLGFLLQGIILIISVATYREGLNEWLLLRVTIFTPSIIYLSTPIMAAFFAKRYERYTPFQFVAGTVLLLCPSIILGFCNCRMVALTMGLELLLLGIISLPGNRQKVMVAIAGAVVVAILSAVFFAADPEWDPFHGPETQAILHEALSSGKLFSADYTIDSMPAALFFAKNGAGFYPAVFVLTFGWVSVFYLLLLGVVCFALFKIGRMQQKGSFQSNYAYGVGILFLIRTIIAIISCFVLYSNAVFLPFSGNFGTCFDIILYASAMAFCTRRKNNIKCEFWPLKID